MSFLIFLIDLSDYNDCVSCQAMNSMLIQETIYPVFPHMLKILYVDRILLEEGAY